MIKRINIYCILYCIKVLAGVLLYFTFASCDQKPSNFLPVSEDVLIRKNKPNPRSSGNIDPNHKWYALRGNVTIDSLVTYKKNKSILLEPLTNASTKSSEVYYQHLSEELRGDSILFSGKYKYENAVDATVQIGIRQIDAMGKTIQTAITLNHITGQKDWVSFQIKTGIDNNTIEFQSFIKSKKDIKLWISGCKISIDDILVKHSTDFGALKDKEFDLGSNIQLDISSPLLIENLEVLGKVWGFLKYYHPEVTQGKYNWDYELFRVLPRIAEAKSFDERNKLLNKWIDQYGKIKETADYSIKDSSLYSRIINLDWIYDKKLFDKKLINKLDHIKNAKRDSSFNYYIVPWMKTLNNFFDREKPYPNITWEDQGYRILTLFRFWNVIEYCFPYVEITDKKWEGIYKEFLPLFLNPEGKADYELLLIRLVAQINDSHGRVDTPSSDLNQTILARKQYTSSIPVRLRVTKKGEIAVEETKTYELERGDVILYINGQEINQIINDLSPYIIASNNIFSMQYGILPFLLRSNGTPIEVIILRNGKKQTLILSNFNKNLKDQKATDSKQKTWQDYTPKAKNIAYINVGSMSNDKMGDIIQENWNTKGIIIDFRTYPNHLSMIDLFSQYFSNREDTFCIFSQNEKVFPGNYKLLGEGIIKNRTSDYYKGKIAVLVNEGTMSHGEFCVMAYQKAPKSKIIGSTTAGADGNIGHFYLPGEIQITYTALGLYYPNWEISQRKGVKIDIEVKPTLKDIQEGRDIWIEQAIKYILDASEF